VQDIAHIHFAALTWLSLGGNKIESIEGLARVQMPSIKNLHLCIYEGTTGKNNITSVGVMRKADWPAIALLNVSKG
jgi:hypothetical protein